jgi:prepilin peptidase CpaA
MLLSLKKGDPRLAREQRAQTRSGDAPANDDDVEIGHSSAWLRIGKPRRLEAVNMTNGLLTEALLGLLAILLVIAAVIDVRTFTISNRLNLTVALLAPVYWLSIGLPLWPGVALHLAVAAAVFFVLALAFWIGMMGGGDVKLAAAVALWFSPQATLLFLVLMSLVGGVLTLIVVLFHRVRKKEGRPEIPYGVAISLGALAILTQRFLNQFA